MGRAWCSGKISFHNTQQGGPPWCFIFRRLLVVCFFSYGPTSVEGKRTHNCGMDEKRVWVETNLARDTPYLVPISSRPKLSPPPPLSQNTYYDVFSVVDEFVMLLFIPFVFNQRTCLKRNCETVKELIDPSPLMCLAVPLQKSAGYFRHNFTCSYFACKLRIYNLIYPFTFNPI